MDFLWILYGVLAGMLMVLTILPKIPHSHWVFRATEFGKIQIFILTILCFALGFFLDDKTKAWYLTQGILLFLIFFHGVILIQYTKLFPTKKVIPEHDSDKTLKFISANIYQFNTEYARFIALINKYQPDVFLTMESNDDWEKALQELEKDYPYSQKVTLENTYGMHFYSKLPIKTAKTHFFVADDIPSVEAILTTEDNLEFVFFGVHPPPPSPTEEKTSKERDGDLLSVAKRLKEINLPSVVVGDFNNVAWSKSSILFRKISELIDPRIGYGFVSTFHAKYRFFRFPIDLLFHSPTIFIKQLKTLEAFGSDHLAVFCEFFIHHKEELQEDKVECATTEEKQEAKEMINEGIQEEGNRDTIAKED